jgi:hypothetical protein
MLQEAFGDNAMSQGKPFLWYKRFKDRGERQSTTMSVLEHQKTAKVCEAILADSR